MKTIKMKNNFFGQERQEFRDRLNHFLHPSGNISLPSQLKGRSGPLRQMRDCFETPGSHAFVWGPRGVGKTSLGHTACEKHSDIVKVAAAVACERSTDFNTLLNDILRSVINTNKGLLRDKSFTVSLEAFGVKIAGKTEGFRERLEIKGPNHAVALLNSIFSIDRFPDTIPVVIIDEFDRLENKETFELISSVLKQMSVDDVKTKFIFCGAPKNLDELLGGDESVERSGWRVELAPLSHDAIWEIIDDIESEFDVRFHRGQRTRISQISSGYAGFTHLILKNVLLKAFEEKSAASDISESLYKSGIHESAQQAATRLKSAYEKAIKRGTDRYIEVLWALANNEHLDRQFKNIQSDYKKIMISRQNREGYDADKNNGQDIRNALNNLTDRGFLMKGKTGWYEFVDPMLRSYVRMVAEREGVELSDESFPS